MLVYFVVILVTLVGFCGLAIDMGRIELRQLQLQAVADAGAVGAAQQLWTNYTGSNPAGALQTGATAEISAVETLNKLASSTNSYVSAASFGPYKGDYSAVQVTVKQSVSTILVGLVSSASKSITLTATAVAQMPPCFIFLSTPGNSILNAPGYYVASASAHGQTFGCPMYSATGFGIDGFAHIQDSQLRTAGAASVSGGGGWTSYPIIPNVPLMKDPMLYLATPTIAACSNTLPMSYTQSTTLTPGTYCGKTTGTITTPAITVSGLNNGICSSTVTLNLMPGLYVFQGGVSFTCVTVSGTGVTIFLTKGSIISFGQFGLYSATWRVSAPVDNSNGGIPGVVLFVDRKWVGGNQDMQFVNSNWYGDGVIYSPATGIYDWATTMCAPNYFNVVAANMYTYGSTILAGVNYSTLPGGNPLHQAVTLVQ